ncbi:MAG: hypothetical protein A2030_09165 [Chloroflexi bacterium RBG_19FT_COMBO_50_10]|nr:MAG: hypothetical protein A2030_09165 [Chloroflexi bacterium RBG_19FT_COMBO_50_10]
MHWLLPDWEYELISRPEKTNLPGYEIRIHSPFGWVYLKAEASSAAKTIHQVKFHNFQLIRAGELLYGSGAVSPISGWTSPTYGDKIPALACILEISQSLPIELKSEWILPNET